MTLCTTSTQGNPGTAARRRADQPAHFVLAGHLAEDIDCGGRVIPHSHSQGVTPVVAL